MKQYLFLIILLIILSGCSNPRSLPTNIGDALSHTKSVMRDQGLVTVGSYSPNEKVKFRIMVSRNITKEEAKRLAEDFIKEFENQLTNTDTDIDTFYKDHVVYFDLKSEVDGEILYEGKRESVEEIWWKF
ncbi:lipoprotein [Paenibacillus paeoniae]|uniref:Uncharacterized protein n=1 Tax=Paenibacillus paeoniae TaxID=2292705 RepID=A0A371PIF7_9BACL|nr:lipoprotein [Paenibacillus paeoniae]REK76012.1 hypothetical protein DX130_02810 [Paenibacillus paeoniae]